MSTWPCPLCDQNIVGKYAKAVSATGFIHILLCKCGSEGNIVGKYVKSVSATGFAYSYIYILLSKCGCEGNIVGKYVKSVSATGFIHIVCSGCSKLLITVHCTCF